MEEKTLQFEPFAPPAKAAKMIGISEAIVRRMIKAGVCPGYYSGNRFYVNVDRTKSLLASKKASDEFKV